MHHTNPESQAGWGLLPALGSQDCLLLGCGQHPVTCPGLPLAKAPLPSAGCSQEAAGASGLTCSGGSDSIHALLWA